LPEVWEHVVALQMREKEMNELEINRLQAWERYVPLNVVDQISKLIDRVHLDWRTFAITSIAESKLSGLGPPWQSNPATCTPINDLMLWKIHLEVGVSTKYNMRAKILIHPDDYLFTTKTAQIDCRCRSSYGRDDDNKPRGPFLPKADPAEDDVIDLSNLFAAWDLPAMIRDPRIPQGWLVWIGKRPGRT
jgi:hypothetical protein